MTVLHTKSLQPTIERIGREIFERAEHASPAVWSMEYWQQQAMDLLTQDPDLKLRLFRFIEALPELPDNPAVARRLRELIIRSNGHPPLPPVLDLALAYRDPRSWYAATVAATARWGCLRMAKQFICGATADEAMVFLRQLCRRDMLFTLDVLGETVTSDRMARGHQQLYIHLIEALSEGVRNWPASGWLDHAPWGAIPRVNISIKLSAIVPGFDGPDSRAVQVAVVERLRPILIAAQNRGAFVNIDMEQYAVKDRTLEIFERILAEPQFAGWPNSGIVIQAYLRDGRRDLDSVIAGARRRGVPVTIRLVKGAYWDSEVAEARERGVTPPVFTEKPQSDASFEELGRVMLENADIVRPAFASHNVRSIAAMLATSDALGLPERMVELQMLTGMGDPLKRALVAMRQRVRVYAPFGDLVRGMAYLIRRLIENTANESFLRQSFGGDTPMEELLSDPAKA